MKPNIKVGSFLLAIVMMFSVFAIAGCTPTTLNKEWSYKTSDNELAIGVYIYSLNAAYSQAESFAKSLTIMIRHLTSGLMKKSRTMTATSRLQESGLKIRLRKCASATS